VSGFRGREEETQRLKPVEDPVRSEAAAKNTVCRAEALEAKAGTLKPETSHFLNDVLRFLKTGR
jgi:hypothetical protein